MTRHTPSNAIRRLARSSTDGPSSELAPPIGAIAVDSLPPRDRSLPAALCAVAGEICHEAGDRRVRMDADQLDRVLEPVVTAVTLLEGYVRLRLSLIRPGGDDPTARGPETTVEWAEDAAGSPGEPIDRDGAILASDHLHASSYAMVAETPVSDARLLELYRLATDRSTTLARQLLARSDGDGTTTDRFAPEATLAGTASALGAVAVGAPTETRTALRSYSHGLMTALASRSTAAATDVDPRATAARVLLDGEPSRHAVGANDNPDGVSSTVERHLDRARTALETLVEAGTDLENGADVEDGTPLDRLERATRIPFQYGHLSDR